MNPRWLKTSIGITILLLLGFTLFLFSPCLIPKGYSCAQRYENLLPTETCDVFGCHEDVNFIYQQDKAQPCYSAGCMAGHELEEALAGCNCKEENSLIFGPPCGGTKTCSCNYLYCACKTMCIKSEKLCQKEEECKWRGKEPWLKQQKIKPVPKDLLTSYQQGVAFVQTGRWSEALPWLKQAIDTKYVDHRIANASDLGYEDFFPRRELGITHYHLTSYSEAIQALIDSLGGEESEKAMFYLNLARSQHLKQTKLDTRAPRISVGFPVGVEYVKELRGRVEGKVNDDFFVAGVSLNGKKLPLWLAQKTVPFRERIPLIKGLNEITISAVDLTGKESSQKVSIIADIDGPLISADYQIMEQTPTAQKILITGWITDETVIQKIILNDKILTLTPAKEIRLKELIILPAGESSLSIQAQDKLGNITRGELIIKEVNLAQNQILLAYFGPLAYYGNLLKKTKALNVGRHLLYASVMGDIPTRQAPVPVIELKGLADQQVLFTEDIYIEGWVRSNSDIISLTINQEPFLKRKGKNLFFSTILKLKEGENQIVVAARDAQGNTGQKRIVLKRKIPQVRAISARMCLTISPFEQRGKTLHLNDLLYDQLISAIISQHRFNLVERNRLEEVLLEQKLSQTELVKRLGVMRLGQILAADAVMIGTLHETEEAIEVYARLVNPQTGVIIDSQDAYVEGKGPQEIRLLADGLALKFKNSFPLVEGLIIKRKGRNVFQDLGAQVYMKPYRNLIAYRELEPVVQPVTKEIIGTDTEDLGEIMVHEVFAYMSQGDIIQEKQDDSIQPKDKVIAK
jgi:hypothetical protein